MMRNICNRIGLMISTLALAPITHAGFVDYFKDEEGETKWQYVANFSGSVLIILLTITLLLLLYNHIRLRKTNGALREIRKNLEKMVNERTANLNESNNLLKKSRDDLEISEAYLKSILDSMPLTLIGLNDEMKITHWNTQAEKFAGVGAEKVLDKYLWDAYPTISLSPEQVKKAMDEGVTKNIKQGQRGIFYLDVTMFPLKSLNVKGLVILVNDITHQTKTENLAIHRDKMSAIGELTSTMGYDLLPPLRSVLGSLDQMLEKLREEDEYSKVKQDIEKELVNTLQTGKRASAIINNLLQFSRSLEDQKQQINLPNVVDHALELAENLLTSASGFSFKDINITKNYASDLPEIPGYFAGLQQVFLSLFRHAFLAFEYDKSKNSSPMITVELNMFYDSLWVKVQHTGKGLTSEEQQVIFEPFFQSDIDNNDRIEDRLSFSYFIITADHGGKMSVTSDVDIGTTFHIQLELK